MGAFNSYAQPRILVPTDIEPMSYPSNRVTERGPTDLVHSFLSFIGILHWPRNDSLQIPRCPSDLHIKDTRDLGFAGFQDSVRKNHARLGRVLDGIKYKGFELYSCFVWRSQEARKWTHARVRNMLRINLQLYGMFQLVGGHSIAPKTTCAIVRSRQTRKVANAQYRIG